MKVRVFVGAAPTSIQLHPIPAGGALRYMNVTKRACHNAMSS